MRSKRSRLDRYLAEHLAINRRDVRLLLAQGRVRVDHRIASDIQQLIDEYTHVQFDDQILQANVPCYVQLHKPRGVVSATKDPNHSTVLELLPRGHPENLHIVGRLDYHSTGLMLLTNDGRWSRRLSTPGSRIKKRYLVGLDKPVTRNVVDAFAAGIYFAYENLTTRPVSVSPVTSHCVELTLEEGRYHQIKRMFGQFKIAVLTLHRLSVGNLVLDDKLSPGKSRHLCAAEVEGIFSLPATQLQGTGKRGES